MDKAETAAKAIMGMLDDGLLVSLDDAAHTVVEREIADIIRLVIENPFNPGENN
jgi:hypothetical protein